MLSHPWGGPQPARGFSPRFPALLACLACSLALPSLAQDERLYWHNNYSEALREARQTQRPVFLEFRCEP